MGSDLRMNYTAFGDAVNVAARLEGVNKYFGTRIIVSKAVFAVLSEVFIIFFIFSLPPCPSPVPSVFYINTKMNGY